jgi:hypothetical protein
MKSFAPCLAVILIGVALLVGVAAARATPPARGGHAVSVKPRPLLGGTAGRFPKTRKSPDPQNADQGSSSIAGSEWSGIEPPRPRLAG